MDEKTRQQIQSVLAGSGSRADKARHLVEMLRFRNNYRWAGIYEVSGEEVVNLGWSGPTAPAHLRFPASQGLCGAAAKSGAAVVVGDVTKDARYLSTLGTTRSEIIVPVKNRAGKVAGLLDAESDEVNAFGDEDRAYLEEWARELSALWE